jgi:general secretion pathway protein D
MLMIEKLRYRTIWVLLVAAMLLYCPGCASVPEKKRPIGSPDPSEVNEAKVEYKAENAPESASEVEKVEVKIKLEKEGPKVIGEIPPSKTAMVGDIPGFGVKGGLAKEKEPAQKEGLTETEEGIILNFDQAPIAEVVNMVGKYLGINYTVDPTVKGTVNLHTYSGISKEKLWSVFLKILRINNIGITESDGFYEIHPLKGSEAYEISLGMGRDTGKGPEGLPIIQVIPLQHILAADVSKILNNFISPTGKILAYPEDNLLFIVDQRWSVTRMLEFIKLFDVSQFSSLTLRMYEIKHVPVTDLTKELEAILKQYGVEGKRPPELSIKLIGLERLNALFVIGGYEELLERTEALIKMLDVPQKEEKETQIYVYPVAHADAEDLATILSNVLMVEIEEGMGAEKAKKVNIATEELASKPAKAERVASPLKEKETKEKRAPSELTAAGHLRKEVKIVADAKRNYLIINAIPEDYVTIKRLLRKLDIVPRQALIEVIIADIVLTDDFKLGLEWQSIGGLGSGSNLGTVTAGTGAGLATGIPSSGLSYAIAKTGELTATLRAMATKDKVNVLSSPSIMTSDNEEASIDISSEVPYLSATSAVTTTEGAISETSTIQYRDTGIILRVTPHISDKGQIKLEISQEVSEAGAAGVSGSPIFIKRSAKTIVHAYDNQTIVIGGLIKKSKSFSNSGVPFLNRLPLIGWLFGYYGESIEKTELIILITARVIDTLEDIDIVSADFKRRIEFLKQQFED